MATVLLNSAPEWLPLTRKRAVEVARVSCNTSASQTVKIPPVVSGLTLDCQACYLIFRSFIIFCVFIDILVEIWKLLHGGILNTILEYKSSCFPSLPPSPYFLPSFFFPIILQTVVGIIWPVL